jgi:hypothetical protein
MKIDELLDKQQQSDISDMINKLSTDKLLKKITFRDMYEEVRDCMSYNQLLAMSSLFVAEKIIERLDKINNKIK